MRAVRLHGSGPGARLAVEEVAPPPAPRGDEVLVRVRACSLNGTDVGVAAGGLPGSGLRRAPRAMGFDLVGEVVALGPRVSAFAVGDVVVALLGHAGGAQAELVLVRSGRAALAPRAVRQPRAERPDPPGRPDRSEGPDHAGPGDAAATAASAVAAAGGLALAGLTALQALHRVAALHTRVEASGGATTVLVVGAAGGIGSIGVRLARLAGARVVALADRARAGHLHDLGADEVLDRDDGGAAGRRFDVVLDAPGALEPSAARALLLPGGTAVSTHPLSRQALAALATSPLRRRPPAYAGVMASPRAGDLDRLVALVDAGALAVPVDSTFALEDVAAAHARLRGGGVRGKVVLTV